MSVTELADIENTAVDVPRTRLGKSDLNVSRLGLGCMGMSEFYGPSDKAQSIDLLNRAVDLGVNFFDTADMYGEGRNEALLAEAFKGRWSEVVLATKFGVLRDGKGGFAGVNGKADYVRQAAEGSLERLGVDTIDLYYCHRLDPDTPIEETVGAMAELVSEGKVRYLGLSEAPPDIIRRANAVHPITALQTEYSLWTRDVESGILATCRELGIGFVAYSPLGRGFLTGAISGIDALDQGDWRRNNPRFQPDTMTANRKFVDTIDGIARRHGATRAQVALAWVLRQGEDIVPIPGTRRIERLTENIGALALTLSDEDLALVDLELPPGAAEGLRYPEANMPCN